MTAPHIRLILFWRSMASSAAESATAELALDKRGPKDDWFRPACRPNEPTGENVMPIYEYKCTKCGKEFEVLQKHFDVDEAPCESCGAPGKRMISNTSFVLKGTGWYVTDYKSNGGCSASGGNSSSKPAKGDDDAAKPAAAATPCAGATSGAGCSSCASNTASSTTSTTGTAS